MAVNVILTPHPNTLLTKTQLKTGIVYRSSQAGSSGFLFFKFGDTVYSFTNNYVNTASSSHERDFYEAPVGDQIILENK